MFTSRREGVFWSHVFCLAWQQAGGGVGAQVGLYQDGF